MKKVLFLVSLLIPILSVCQEVYELNNIKAENEDVIDVQIQNPTDETIYLLRVESKPNVTSRIYSKQIPPRRKVPLRLKLNPKKKGKISEEVKLYFSHQAEPIRLILNAKVQDIPKNNRQACPSFGGGGGFTLNPKTGVYEKEEAGEFQKVTLSLENRTLEEKPAQLAEESKVEEKVETPIQQNEKEPRVEKQKLSPEERRSQPSLLEKLFGDTETKEADKKDPSKTATKTPEKASFKESGEKADSLLGDEFKPNNVVFLIDASTSMREEDKMDLLKQTMISLLNPLREKDFLSIVTYSGESEVLLPPTSGIQKEAIKKIIEDIKADGSTQAVKGIQQAIKTGRSNFLEDGNNQIILATDGAFDIGERNKRLRNKIERNAQNGLEVIVLGIKNERWTNKSLKEIAELGNGELLHCKSKKDTQKVLEAVKESALH
ncbi:MAG: VWA domain-containing protein [Vicingaceae bacterium]